MTYLEYTQLAEKTDNTALAQYILTNPVCDQYPFWQRYRVAMVIFNAPLPDSECTD